MAKKSDFTDNALAPVTAEGDLSKTVENLTNTVNALITDREEMQARIADLENSATVPASGDTGTLAQAVERELGKLRRAVQGLHDGYFRNDTATRLDPAEPIVAPDEAGTDTVDGGAGRSTGATSEPGSA